MNDEIIIFEDQEIKLEVNMKDETVWLTQQQMAKLFDRDVKTISKHIKNALGEELDEKSNSQKMRIANSDKLVNFYNLLFKENRQIIDNNTLVALTLLIALSNPKEKNILVDLVMNFLV